MNVWQYPIFHRGDEREKKGIRKEWAERRNEPVMWKRSGGETGREENDQMGQVMESSNRNAGRKR